jgi:CRISPR-associated endonuclease Csy4
MDYYIEIKLLKNPEFTFPFLMNTIFMKLHKILHDLKSTTAGVSFPNYDCTLGDVLRLHGDQEILNLLNPNLWIGTLKDYCTISEIREVPESTQYRVVYRKQPTMSHSKLKRLVKRGSISPQDVTKYLKLKEKNLLKGPYLELKSNSNKNIHRRYIEQGALLQHPTSGEFDYFGLSKEATIPWF